MCSTAGWKTGRRSPTRTCEPQPLDRLKSIPLPFDDPKSYVSLGLTVRERFELNDAPLRSTRSELSESD
jgi:hypothetical protein